MKEALEMTAPFVAVILICYLVVRCADVVLIRHGGGSRSASLSHRVAPYRRQIAGAMLLGWVVLMYVTTR